jgi:hypothetical protein
MAHVARVLLLAVLILPVVAAADPPGVSPTPWEKIGEEDGIVTYRREIPASPVVAIKGEGMVEASILRVASVLLDTRRLHEWTDSLKEAHRIRTVSKTEYVEYDHITTPFILKDRDFVVDTKIEMDASQKKITLRMHSVSDPAAPPTSYVRGELFESTYALTSVDRGRRTAIVADVRADPKGSIPKWMVNHYQKSWAHDTIAHLRDQVRKSDIVDDTELRATLATQGYFN